jgi:hypothetical protein
MILINVNYFLENIKMKYFITSFRFWSKNVTSTLNEHIILLLKLICSTCLNVKQKKIRFSMKKVSVFTVRKISNKVMGWIV